MTPLPPTFRAHGYAFRLIKRQAHVALFEKSRPHHARPTYEVVILQHRPAVRWPDGRVSQAREAMPGSEQWGASGWTFCDLPSAQRKFDALTNGPAFLYRQGNGATFPSARVRTAEHRLGRRAPAETCDLRR